MPTKSPHKRKRPLKLASKLLEIRLRLNESQNGMLRRLGLEEEFERDYVSKWERSIMEPPLHVLCAYAEVANIYLEVLARDVLELPLEIPSKAKSMGLKIAATRSMK
jgi:transcriptional regulator with XRE-family HTH domain